MKIKDLVDESFQDYKVTSMFICTNYCDGKCWKESGLSPDICQNTNIIKQKTFNISDEKIIERYVNNPITSAIVFGGLEPFDQFDELRSFISRFREVSNDDVVIYVGYKEEEVLDKTEMLKEFPNIIIKFGRYVPNAPSRYDEILGVTLASDNQYAKKIS